jgi:hypothetical protein
MKYLGMHFNIILFYHIALKIITQPDKNFVKKLAEILSFVLK